MWAQFVVVVVVVVVVFAAVVIVVVAAAVVVVGGGGGAAATQHSLRSWFCWPLLSSFSPKSLVSALQYTPIMYSATVL